MRNFRVQLLALAILVPSGAMAQAVSGSWSQTWGAEFNGGQADLSGWTYDLGNGGPSLPGWGNNELQNYTSSTANVSVSGGSLHITAIANNNSFTSGRIRTSELFSQTYGLFEVRAKLPVGQGLWPAIWMMPKDSSYGVWPASGEIDILESVGQSDKLVQGTLHSGPNWSQVNVQTQTFAGSGLQPAGFSTHEWHVYDLRWEKGMGGNPGSISWYVDGIKYGSRTGGWSVPAGGGADAPFDKPFYLILNMAVGGNYVGQPSLANGGYDMQVDYVRTYAAVPAPPSAWTLGVGLAVLVLGWKRNTLRDCQEPASSGPWQG